MTLPVSKTVVFDLESQRAIIALPSHSPRFD
jgi:hypothetical protein